MNRKWTEELPFILTSYIIAFFPWVYFTITDHITARWQPAQRLVKSAWTALIVQVFSTIMLLIYISIQFAEGDIKEALAAVVVLLAGYGPYIRTAREFWIIYAFRDFEWLLDAIPVFSFEHRGNNHRRQIQKCASWVFPSIKYANSSSFFDNDSPGDGVLDLSLGQWVVNGRFYHSACRRRYRRPRLRSVPVQKYLSWSYHYGESEHFKFTSEKRYRDAMSICYYETRALKSTPFNTFVKNDPRSFIAFVSRFILDMFHGYPSKRWAYFSSNSSTTVPWRMDYDHDFDEEFKNSFKKDISVRKAWMYENLFGRMEGEGKSPRGPESASSLKQGRSHMEPSDIEHLFRFGFMVDVADKIITTISEFCRNSEQLPNDGDVREWKTAFSWYKSITQENSENHRVEATHSRSSNRPCALCSSSK